MISQLAGQVTTATTNNKILRFAKQHSDASLQFQQLGERADVTFTAYCGAASACRHGNASQGGYLILMTHKSIKDGAAVPYLLVDWRSWKLPRMPRSSLSAEAQAASETADAMMYNITFWQLIWHPTPASDDITACQLRNKPCIVTDAKALYDLLTKQELQPNSAWSRQTNVCRTTRHTRQAQMHAGRDKMGLIRATIHRRHDKSISSSTTCPAATHTLHQHQARRTVHSSKKEKRSRQEEKR